MKDYIFVYMLIVALCMFLFLPNVTKAENLDFDPARDGYIFRNYGPGYDNRNDLSAHDMIQLFGADTVCVGGRPQGCQLTPPADTWLRQKLLSNQRGHCDGMCATALRLWVAHPQRRKLFPGLWNFRNRYGPSHWQQDAIFTSQLLFGQDLGNFIAFHQLMTRLREVGEFRNRQENLYPVRIAQLVKDSFSNPGNLYLLSVYEREIDGHGRYGRYVRGHTVLPIGLTEEPLAGGSSQYRIALYDPNTPGVPATLKIRNDGKWVFYRQDNIVRYQGSNDSQSLRITRISDRNRNLYQCPWVLQEGNDGLGDTNFSFGGAGDMLITDPNGKKVGYDAGKHSAINEISGAQELPSIDSLAEEGEAVNYMSDYFIPYRKGGAKPYEIRFSGGELKKESNANFTITAPGFVAGFDRVSLDPSETLKMTITPDGKTIEYVASADGETPMLFITLSDGVDKPSYRFEVGIRELRPGVKLTMKVDIANGKLYFKDDNGEEDIYELKMGRIMPDGERDTFATGNVDMFGPDSFQVDLKDWNNETDPCIKDDDNGNGFEDEPCGDEDN